jgi:probable HAF family extracellular repeat protein
MNLKNRKIVFKIYLMIFAFLLLASVSFAFTSTLNTNFEKSPISAGFADINIIDLGTLPNNFSSKAHDINNLGEIIGESDGFACYWSIGREVQPVEVLNSEGTMILQINDLSQVSGYYDPITMLPEPIKDECRPFIWTPLDGEAELGNFLNGDQGQITSVNNLGQAVGWTQAFSDYKRAFLWTEEGVTDIGTLGGLSSQALDINDLGQITGYSQTSDGESHAFFWSQESGIEDIGTLGGITSYSVDLNNLGQVVGSAETSTGENHAFLWTSDAGMTDLGTLGHTYSFVSKINDQGYIIGGVADSIKGPYQAFLWTQESGMTLIAPTDTYLSEATDINNLGEIVGYYYFYDNLKLPCHAFAWTSEESFIDLGTLGGEYSDAFAINDFGQVVGSSGTVENQLHAVVWELPQQTTGIIINEIEDLIEEGELNAGQGTALTAKLEAAIVLMNKGKFLPAQNLLQAFINQVNSLINNGALSQEDGYPLIAYAQELLDLISE